MTHFIGLFSIKHDKNLSFLLFFLCSQSGKGKVQRIGIMKMREIKKKDLVISEEPSGMIANTFKSWHIINKNCLFGRTWKSLPTRIKDT